MEKESIISLLRKLMAQADGEKAVGNRAAAEAFAAKAQELLLKHKLTINGGSTSSSSSGGNWWRRLFGGPKATPGAPERSAGIM